MKNRTSTEAPTTNNKKQPRDLLLEQIASEGFNVGYSASLHFATFDLVTKLPTAVTVVSFAAGVLGLAYPDFTSKLPSAILLTIGFCMHYIRDYESRLNEYESAGIALNNLYKSLHDLAIEVESITDRDKSAIETARARLASIRSDASKINVSPQVFGASWKAHHRFFWVIDSTWVQKNRSPPITLFDKAPLSFFILLGTIAAAMLLLAGKILICSQCSGGAG